MVTKYKGTQISTNNNLHAKKNEFPRTSSHSIEETLLKK